MVYTGRPYWGGAMVPIQGVPPASTPPYRCTVSGLLLALSECPELYLIDFREQSLSKANRSATACSPWQTLDERASSGVSEQLAEMRARPDGSLGPVLQPELAQNGLHVHLNRRLGDDQPARDDLI
jgi:hypothetical protein